MACSFRRHCFLWNSRSGHFSRHRFVRLRGSQLGGKAKPQSGCLPFGSLLTTAVRLRASRHRLIAGRPAAAQVHHSLTASQRTNHHGILLDQSHVENSSHCRPLPAENPLHNVQQQIQGAAMRFAIKFTARASGLKPSSTSRHSLTFRSSRHLQAPLVGSLRAAHSGAAYL